MKLCEVCGSEEHPAWKAHTFKKAEAKVEAFRVLAQKEPEVDKVAVKVVRRVDVRLGRSANRRGKEAYNAYQKDYMKVWRAVKAGRACSWPRA